MAEKPEETSEKKEQNVLKYKTLIDKDRKYILRESERIIRPRISQDDYIILRMIQDRHQRRLKRKPTLTELIHRMIGIALDCEYNEHHELIERLKLRISLQVLTLRKYREKYGYPPKQSTLS